MGRTGANSRKGGAQVPRKKEAEGPVPYWWSWWRPMQWKRRRVEGGLGRKTWEKRTGGGGGGIKDRTDG